MAAGHVPGWTTCCCILKLGRHVDWWKLAYNWQQPLPGYEWRHTSPSKEAVHLHGLAVHQHSTLDTEKCGRASTVLVSMHLSGAVGSRVLKQQAGLLLHHLDDVSPR